LWLLVEHQLGLPALWGTRHGAGPRAMPTPRT